ncbi:MAG: prepilin-type N-terminal cleavage/methylation domain-containing protein [Planctomycetota bacterium]|jgi:type II secretory pathway pseudopilin PulG
MRLRSRSVGAISGRRSRDGHTLIEVLVALSVLMMAVIVYSQAVTNGIRAQQSIAERSTALNAAREMLEQIKAADFTDAYALYNDIPGDDPDGIGTAPGDDFTVDGLDPQQGQNFEGEILFPEVGGVLSETAPDANFGMPYDLNNDGDALDEDVSGDYLLLPVIVRIEWNGCIGDSELEVRTWLTAGI